MDFNFVCRRIRPEQVISLILSDDNDTPGQTELFFSRFRLEEFIHLRSLTLIKIEFESFEAIFVNLNKLKQLKALSFNNGTFRSKYPLRFRDDPDACNQINLLLSDTFSLILAQLNRLHLNMNINLTRISLSNLRHLKLERCFIDDLNSIFHSAPKLKSLDIVLYVQKPIDKMNFITSQLIQLKLVIQGKLAILIEHYSRKFSRLSSLNESDGRISIEST
jgi:hypothetical protein